jgi:hypothetical protein
LDLLHEETDCHANVKFPHSNVIAGHGEEPRLNLYDYTQIVDIDLFAGKVNSTSAEKTAINSGISLEWKSSPNSVGS